MRSISLGAVLALLLTTPLARATDDPRPLRDPFEEALRRMDEFRRMLDIPHLAKRSDPPRLGVEVRTPDAALADQLDLPREQGLVLAGITPGSAAEKAGLKKNDILLEMAGKPVPARPAEFVKLVGSLEAGKPFDAVVLRKGRKETLNGVTLSEAKPQTREDLGIDPFSTFPGFPDFGLDLKVVPLVQESKRITVSRLNDTFTATQKDGETTVTIKGTVEQGKAKIESVEVDDRDGKKSYAPDKVPEAHKSRVETLARIAAGESR